MGRSAIEWTDETWNPVIGCSRVSEGCRRCYAEQAAAGIVRKAKGKLNVYDDTVHLVGGEPRWTGVVKFLPERLAQPLGWRRPRRVFVNSMSDLFHEKLTNEQIAAVFGVMAAASSHTFQVLTKRADRMREWFAWIKEHGVEQCSIEALCQLGTQHPALEHPHCDRVSQPFAWPLPNVWLGVSVENQAAADERIPELLRTPASIRFLSCEPLLGELDLRAYLHRGDHRVCPRCLFSTNRPSEATCPNDDALLGPDIAINQVIAGCESGPGARPIDADAFRSLRDQCAAAGVAYFLKQAVEDRRGGTCTGCGTVSRTADINSEHVAWGPDELGRAHGRSGRVCGRFEGLVPIAAGPGSHRKPGGVIGAPYLDGVQHLAFPEVRHAR